MPREVVQIRVRDRQKRAWVKEAARCGMELSLWMRWVLDGELLPTNDYAGTGEVSIDRPIVRAPREPKPVPKKLIRVLCARCLRDQRVRGMSPPKECSECRWE